MQQTNKYHFNIIDPSDDFSPEKLNDNARTLEAALTQHETTVSAALAQHKSATDSALSAHESAANARVSAVEARVDAGANFVKLGSGTAATSKTVTFDLSGVNMNDYAALLLFGSAYGTDASSTLSTVLSVNSKEMVRNLIVNPAKVPVIGLTVLQPVSSYVMALTWYSATDVDGLSNSRPGGTFYHSRITQSWSGITKVSVASASTVTSATMTLYGLKK